MQLYHGDCLDIMPTLPAQSVDMVFADPPFNVGIAYGGKAGNDRRTDYYEWCEAWIGECFRVLKPTGTIYLMTITRHLESLYPMMKTRGVFINQVNWRNVSSVGSNRYFRNDYQPILVYGKTADYKFSPYAQTKPIGERMVYWGKRNTEPKGQLLDYWNDIPPVSGGSAPSYEAILKAGSGSKAHPAQMPIRLAARCILFSTDRGDVILDPFAGSGSTGVACIQERRNFIGIEKDAGYFAIASERIANTQPPLPLFEQEPPATPITQSGLFNIEETFA